VTISLTTTRTIGFVMSPQLGDSLIAMIIVHNLQLQGYEVTVFSNHLYALRRWFPGKNILPYPDATSVQRVLKPFDLLLHTYPRDVLGQADRWHPHVVVLDKDPLYRRLINMVDLQVVVCQELFGFTQVVRSNGLIAPPEYQQGRYKQRVVIHPTSNDHMRCWLPKRFIAVAGRLKKLGYTPVFVVAPAEIPKVGWITQHNFVLYTSESLDELAGFLYESGEFIGNDSGVGHLASNVGLPTVSLMQRRKVKLRWSPNWALGEALLPGVPLILKSWKECYWKYFISVNKVLNAFARVQAKYNKLYSSPMKLE
jgi:heptosyltransferase III